MATFHIYVLKLLYDEIYLIIKVFNKNFSSVTRVEVFHPWNSSRFLLSHKNVQCKTDFLWLSTTTYLLYYIYDFYVLMIPKKNNKKIFRTKLARVYNPGVEIYSQETDRNFKHHFYMTFNKRLSTGHSQYNTSIKLFIFFCVQLSLTSVNKISIFFYLFVFLFIRLR